MMYLALRGIVPRCCRGSVESLSGRSSGLPCLALKLSFHSRLIVAFIGSFALHLRATFASAIRSAAHLRYLRASWDSLSPKRSKKHFLCDDSRPLACLARKLTFSSRLIVAFIGSFALHLRATLASAIRSAAHFSYDN